MSPSMRVQAEEAQVKQRLAHKGSGIPSFTAACAPARSASRNQPDQYIPYNVATQAPGVCRGGGAALFSVLHVAVEGRSCAQREPSLGG